MSSASPGLIDGLRGLSATLVRSLKTRVELAQVEFEQERQHLTRDLSLVLLTVFFLAFGAFLTVIWLMLVLPEEWRASLAGGSALVFLLVAGAGLLSLLRDREKRPALLGGLVTVMQGDIDALTGKESATAGLGSGTPRAPGGAVVGGARP